MPELPEVEITVRTLKKYIIKQKIYDVTIFNANLRYKIPSNLPKILKSQTINEVKDGQNLYYLKLIIIRSYLILV